MTGLSRLWDAQAITAKTSIIQGPGSGMYAVVYQVDMNEAWEGDPVEAVDQLAAFAKAMPGFIKGTWTLPDPSRRGVSFTLWASEGDARTVANIPHPSDGPVKIRSVDVYQVALDV